MRPCALTLEPTWLRETRSLVVAATDRPRGILCNKTKTRSLLHKMVHLLFFRFALGVII